MNGRQVSTAPFLATRYGLGSIGTGLYSSVPGVLLLFYMTDVLRIDAGLAAAAIFFPKLFGALFDPVVGSLSDRTTSRYGRRLPWMAAGGLTFTIALGLVFSGLPTSGSVSPFWLVAALYLLSSVGYSAFAVPYLALPAEITDDPAFRVGIISRRMIFVMLGIMLGSAIAPILVTVFGGGIGGYRYMGWVVAGASLAAVLVSLHLTAGLDDQRAEVATSGGLRQSVQVVMGNPAFRRLLLVFFLQTLGGAAFLAVLPYIVTSRWQGDEAQVGMLMFVLLCASTCALPVWERCVRHWSKWRCLVAATVFSGFAYLLLVTTLLVDSLALRLTLFGCIGLAFAGLQLLPFAMAADLIHSHAGQTGQRAEAAFTGAWTSVEKLALALSAPVAAVIVSLSGYHSAGIAGGQVVQSAFRVSGPSGDLLLPLALLVPLAAQLLCLTLLLSDRSLNPAPHAPAAV